MTSTPAAPAPEPEEIYRRTQEEGRRRLSRPRIELAATAFVAGFDIVFGVVALGVVATLVTPHFGAELGELVGAVAFGVSFVFVVVGRSELFTENFLVPIAGLERQERRSWAKLAELWTLSPILNILGGTLLVLVVSTEGVLPEGTPETLNEVAARIDERSALAAFMSAVAGGALVTLMTWLVEGAQSMGVRITVAWIIGSLLVLGPFNHVIVGAIEMLFGLRFGADLGWEDFFANLGLATAGNLLGGVVFVTLSRFGQAKGSNQRRSSES